MRNQSAQADFAKVAVTSIAGTYRKPRPLKCVLPRLGWNMETGRLGEWLKRDGERVEAGEILFTVEGDKATQEVEALESGILRIPPDSPPPGKEVPVGTLLGYLMAEGEEIADSGWQIANSESPMAVRRARSAEASYQPSARSREPSARGRQLSAISYQPSTIGPLAWPASWAWTGPGSRAAARTGRIVERDVRQAAAAANVAQIAIERMSPLARRRAAELGVDGQMRWLPGCPASASTARGVELRLRRGLGLRL